MQNRRGIEVLWWDEERSLTIALCIEKFIDNVLVAKTHMFAASKQFGLSIVNVQQLCKVEEPADVRHK